MSRSTLQDRLRLLYSLHIDHTRLRRQLHLTTSTSQLQMLPLTPEKSDSSTSTRDSNDQDDVDYHVIKPDGLSVSPTVKREAQNTRNKKAQSEKSLLQSIFEKSAQDPLALEQSFHPPDINQVSNYKHKVLVICVFFCLQFCRRNLFSCVRRCIA